MTPARNPYTSIAPAPTAAGEPVPARTRRSTRIAWAGVAVSIVCLYIALRSVDLRQVGATLLEARMAFVLPLVAAQVMFYVLKAMRWRLLLSPICAASWQTLVAPMMIGFMGNNVLPARLGELIRVYLGARLLTIAPSQVLATLMLERMFDVVAVMLFLGWGVVVMGNVPHALLSAGYVAAAISVGGMLGAAAFAVWTRPLLQLAERLAGFLPSGIRRVILRQLELGASGMTALRKPRLIWGIVVTSLLQWLLMAACIYVSLLAFDIAVPPTAAFVVLASTVFGVMIPAAPGFVGTLHLSFVLALTPFAVGDSQAMAAAVFFHIIPYLGVTLSGLYFLRKAGIRLGQVEHEALRTESQTV